MSGVRHVRLSLGLTDWSTKELSLESDGFTTSRTNVKVDHAQRELFEAVILDHDGRPRHFHVMTKPSHSAEGNNPICGDRYRVYLEIDQNRISSISFDGFGCAISKASASIMASMLNGSTIEEAECLYKAFHEMMLSQSFDDGNKLGDLVALAGVRRYPSRVKCATLAWHTMRAAVRGELNVTTE